MRIPTRPKKPSRWRWPSVRLPEGTGRRLLLGLLTVCGLFVASSARIVPQRLNLVEGDVADRTIRAPRSGVYVDEEAMARLREEAARTVPDVYEVDPNATEDALTALDDIFERINEVRADPLLPGAVDRARRLRETLDIRLSPETLELAVSETTPDTALTRLHDSLATVVRKVMARQIRSNTDDLAKAREDLREAVRGLGLTSRYTAMAAEIGQAVLKANMIYDPVRTEAARQEKRQSVRDVLHPIQMGEIIVLAGEQIRPRHIAAFQAVGLIQQKVDYYQALGILGAFAVMVLVLGIFVAWFSPETHAELRRLALIGALLVIGAFAYRNLEPTAWFEPGALTAAVALTMTVALLLGPMVAVGMAVCLGMLLPVVALGSDARLTIVTVLCTCAGAFSVSGRGSKGAAIVRASILVAVVDALMLAAAGEVFGVMVSGRVLYLAALGGLASPLLAMGASVALERVLGVTTDFRLMELGNPHEPILERYIAEAPGSYQASLMVGHLGELAAEAIGANALLVRTAAIYHDIGKIRRPYFFVENQFGGDNPHERLSPHLSALVITAHVRDGVELAQEYGLPPVIQDFIREHHGTTLIRFFYQRALDLADDPSEVMEASFRYPGPKPRSRETAILMLADTIEAAARTLERPSQLDIQQMVDRLVDEKIRDGQLDECPLSFRDLAIIKRTFVASLTGMFHQRVRYPEQIAQEAQRFQREANARSRGRPVAAENGARVQEPDPLAVGASDAAQTGAPAATTAESEPEADL